MRPEHADPELDALLQRSRPEPEGAWVHATGERLFAPRPTRSRLTLRLGTAFAVGLAALALILSLAGVGPLADSNAPVQARDGCRDVTVTRVERVPSVVTTPDGETKIVYSRKTVRRTVRRCR